jgi:hypothetical protein
LNWDGAAVNSGGSEILRFRVFRVDDTGSSVERGTTEATVFNFSDSVTVMMSQYSTAYTYSVKAENLIGLSADGDSLSVSVTPKASPSDSVVTFPSTSLETEVEFSVSATVSSSQTKDSTGATVTDSTLLYLVVSNVCEVDGGFYCARVSSSHSKYVSDLLKGKRDFASFSSSGSGTYYASYKPKFKGPYTFAVWQLTQGGVKGDYWDNIWASGTVDTSKTDSTLDLTWDQSALITTYAGDFVSGVWQGFVKAEFSEEYTFYAWADDGVKVSVGQQTVIDSWETCCTEISGSQSLTAGELILLEVRWRQLQRKAKLKLEWKSYSRAREVIPAARLYYPDYLQDTPVQKDVVIGRSTAALCYQEGLTTPMTAESSYSINLYSVDGYGAALTNSGDVYSLEFTGTSSTSFVSSYSSSNLSTASVVLTKAESYSLAITLYGTHIKNSPFSVTVTAGTISSDQSTTGLSTLISSTTLVANTQYSYSFSAKDAYGNTVTTTSAKVQMTSTWQSDYYTSPIGVDYPTDYDANYGKNYEGYADSGSIYFTIPRAAEYSVVIMINDAEIGSATSMTIQHSSISAAKSIAVYPSSTSTAGAAYSFKVQGRDLYYNSVKTTVSSLSSTSVTATGPATYTTTLSDDSSNLGVYSASLTFEKVGEYTLTVKVNGKAISNSGQKVTVSSASASASQSEVTGLPSAAIVGDSVKGVIYMRDAYSNSLSSVSGTLAVAVSGAETLSPSVTQASDGTYSFTFTTTAIGTYSVSVTYDSSSVAPTPKSISVTVGQVRAAKSTLSIGSDNVVGQTVLTITAKDSQGNTLSSPVDHPRMLPQAFSASLLGPTSLEITATYTDFSAYLIDLESVATAGDYSVVLSLLQQGGLQAFYYEADDFTSFSGSLSTHNHADTEPQTYTKIEPTIDLDWGTGSPSEFSSSHSDYFSVLWTGRLRANYTEDVTFYVTCSDLVRLTLGGEVLIDSLTSGSAVASQSAVKSLSEDKFYELTIEYVEKADEANIKLEWSSLRMSRHVVPSSALFALLNSEASPYSLTLKSGDTSAVDCTLSAYSGDSAAYNEATQDVEKLILLTAKDGYGNTRDTSAETFTATLEESGSSVTVSVTGESDGLYKLAFTAASAGTFDLRVYYEKDGVSLLVKAETVTVSVP